MILNKKTVSLLCCSIVAACVTFIPSRAMAQTDMDKAKFWTDFGLDLADKLIDNGSSPGGGGGGGYVDRGVVAPNGVRLYSGQSTTLYGIGFYTKYWRCGNPRCYKLHSRTYNNPVPGGGGGGHFPPPPPPPPLRYVIGITTQSVGTGVQVQSFTRNHNRGVLRIGDIIQAARLPNGQQIQIRTHDQLTRAKDIAGPTSSMQVLVWSPYNNSSSWRQIWLNSGAGPGGSGVITNGNQMVPNQTGEGVFHMREGSMVPNQTGQGVQQEPIPQTQSNGDYGTFR